MKWKNSIIKAVYLLLLSGLTSALLNGCTAAKGPLDANNPVTLTMWHVFGSQTNSPMNDMADEFNRTIGKDNGVIINVTSVTNSSDIHDALTAAADAVAGAGSMPDLFFCYPETAKAIGMDRIVAWDDLFTESELALYVPSFLEEGMVDGKLLVFPVAKSSEALFVNATVFDRFAADTGVTYDSMATWEGLFYAAEKYYGWSGGQSFLKFDSMVNYYQINTKASGGQAFKDGKLDFNDHIFKARWETIAKGVISGHFYIGEDYATACMMTGEIAAAICSTASILYFQDTVTYRDNTTEPLVLKPLPYPVARDGMKLVIQQGVGLAASVKGDAKKEAAALLFAKWITEGEVNLRFVTMTGYMPVQRPAFEAVDNYDFKSGAYRDLYVTMDVMRSEYQFFITPLIGGYNGIVRRLNENTFDILTDCKARYKAGENSLDALTAESYEAIRQVMER